MGPSYTNLFVGYIENLFYYFSQFLSLAFLDIKLTIQSAVTTVYLLGEGYKPTDSNVRPLNHNTSEMPFHSLNFLD